MPNEEQKSGSNFTPVKEVMDRAQRLKQETESLIQDAKDLSKTGVKEAEHLIEFAKSNWKTLVGITASLGLGAAIRSKMKKGKSAKKTSTKKTTSKKKASVKMKALPKAKVSTKKKSVGQKK